MFEILEIGYWIVSGGLCSFMLYILWQEKNENIIASTCRIALITAILLLILSSGGIQIVIIGNGSMIDMLNTVSIVFIISYYTKKKAIRHSI